MKVAAFRSSRPEVFCKEGVLRNFTKFTGKHLIKLQASGLRKKRLWHRRFPVNFVKFLRTHFFIEHPWWLLLSFTSYLSHIQISSLWNYSQRKQCPHSELFWCIFSRIRSEEGEILRISLYSVRMRENSHQNNTEYGHLLLSDCHEYFIRKLLF